MNFFFSFFPFFFSLFFFFFFFSPLFFFFFLFPPLLSFFFFLLSSSSLPCARFLLFCVGLCLVVLFLRFPLVRCCSGLAVPWPVWCRRGAVGLGPARRWPRGRWRPRVRRCGFARARRPPSRPLPALLLSVGPVLVSAGAAGWFLSAFVCFAVLGRVGPRPFCRACFFLLFFRLPACGRAFFVRGLPVALCAGGGLVPGRLSGAPALAFRPSPPVLGSFLCRGPLACPSVARRCAAGRGCSVAAGAWPRFVSPFACGRASAVFLSAAGWCVRRGPAAFSPGFLPWGGSAALSSCSRLSLSLLSLLLLRGCSFPLLLGARCFASACPVPPSRFPAWPRGRRRRLVPPARRPPGLLSRLALFRACRPNFFILMFR